MGQLVHLHDRLIDLLDAGALLNARCCHLAHDVGHPHHTADDLLHGGAGLIHQATAFLHFADRVANQGLDFLGRHGTALCQATHLGRHHRKAASLIAGTRRFHGGVKGQDIGLESDAVDNTDDVANPLRRLVDVVHGSHHLCHLLPALRDDLGRTLGQCIGLARIVCVLLHRGHQLFGRGTGFFQRAGLALGTFGQIHVASGNLARGAHHMFGIGANLQHHLLQVRLHGGHCMHNAAGGRPRMFQIGAQVAIGDDINPVHHLGRLAPNLMGYGTRCQPGKQYAQQRKERDHAGEDCQMGPQLRQTL